MSRTECMSCINPTEQNALSHVTDFQPMKSTEPEFSFDFKENSPFQSKVIEIDAERYIYLKIQVLVTG